MNLTLMSIINKSGILMNRIPENIDNNPEYSLVLESYTNDQELVDFIRFIAHALNSTKKRGTLAFLGVAAAEVRLITLAAWYVGWRVSVLPETGNHQFMLEKAEVDLLLCESKGKVKDIVEEKISDCLILYLQEESESFFSWLETKDSERKDLLEQGCSWTRNEVALILFTSGSTGEPKGVCHSLSGILASAARFIHHFKINAHEKILNTAGLHTMSGFRVSIVLGFLSKCQVDALNNAADIWNIIQQLKQFQSNILLTGPNLVRQISLLSEKLSEGLGEKESGLSGHLKVILSTGAQIDSPSKLQVHANLGISVMDYYGLTETGGLAIAESIDEFSFDHSFLGKACVDIKLKVLTSDNQERDFGKGELRVYSDSIYLGYLAQEAYHRDFFDTGDQVEIHASGQVTWLYRLKSGVKAVSTEWIYTEVVHSWLQNFSIEDCYVSSYYDSNQNARFIVEVTGIGKTEWNDWKNQMGQILVEQLGDDYNIVDWCRVDEIVRSSLGKYIKSITEDDQ